MDQWELQKIQQEQMSCTRGGLTPGGDPCWGLTVWQPDTSCQSVLAGVKADNTWVIPGGAESRELGEVSVHLSLALSVTVHQDIVAQL